jgi:hypothetical protein
MYYLMDQNISGSNKVTVILRKFQLFSHHHFLYNYKNNKLLRQKS